jgi:RNA polymerase sigma factor (sigma-70 family)
MLLQIHGIGKQKISYKNHTEIKFDDLKTYLLLAKKAISKFGPKFYKGLSNKMLQDEDAIASVANAIIMADWRWDDNYIGKRGEKKTRYSYRNQCALWAIQTYVSKSHKQNNKKRKAISLDQCINNDDNMCLHGLEADNKTLPPDTIVMEQESDQNIRSLIGELLNSEDLSDRQKDYIKLYYFEEYTFDKIGKKYGITREAVRQGLNKALDIIKRSIGDE